MGQDRKEIYKYRPEIKINPWWIGLLEDAVDEYIPGPNKRLLSAI